ncbi:uncharacterized protein LOC142639376 [Castanea sativa]|uniref:uncharacterized protein LOC142639376 n=1 Tax=Castanea sativa TaxID=21020 RepID=UPI003F6538F9
MTETQAAAMNMVNEAIASLRTTSDHHDKDIHEIQKILGIHTRTLNEMNQTLNAILQKLNSQDSHSHSPQRTIPVNQSSSALSLARLVKLEFPCFSGDDLASWVYKANQYFGYYQTPIAEKLLIASFHMELETLIWFQEGEEAGVFTNWDSLVQALHVRFGSTAYDDPMEVLTRLRQSSTVAMYKAEFEAVSNRIKGLSPLHKLSCFLSGLKDEIRLPIRMLNPRTLNEAFELAKIQEEYVFSYKKSSKFQQETGKGSILGLPKNNVVIESKPKIPIKRLTPAQMDERRKRGLCYNCDEKWVVGHKELEEEVENEGVNRAVSQEEEVETTLYALIGTPTPSTMRVKVDVTKVLEVKVANGSVVKTQVYSKSLADHVIHLRKFLEILATNKLYAKRSKCMFACNEVEYLGHVITAEGVHTDPRKVAAMQQWPIPKDIKSLRGFLGLTGYYRKFFKGYGQIAVPLTALLKKDSFFWSNEAKLAFQKLKDAMVHPLVLAFPNFDQPFVVECDASGRGVGAVLMQQGRPIAYHSQILKGKNLALSTYEKELLALVIAIKRWRAYLVGRPFTVKTDQQSLKYLLEQKIGTPAQLKWFAKLLGYVFVVEYKKGKGNLVVEMLSRKEILMTVFQVEFQKLMKEYYAWFHFLLQHN